MVNGEKRRIIIIKRMAVEGGQEFNNLMVTSRELRIKLFKGISFRHKSQSEYWLIWSMKG